MQNLTRLVNEAKKHGADNNKVLNLVREYLQVLILKAIYQSKYGAGLCFIGGTCLRICYDLKRFSEDLDFSLDRKVKNYSFDELNEIIVSFLKNTDFDVDVNVKENKVVQKSFIRVNKVLHVFGLSPLKDQKLHVKLEIDTNPVKIRDKEVQTFFVTKFNEMFPILMHTDDTLFAGKICAVLNRAYTKGRDFYDLLWYLNQKKNINVSYLNRALKQSGVGVSFRDGADVMKAVGKKVNEVDINDVLRDIDRFLEDSTEMKTMKNYPAVFAQMLERYLGKGV